MKTGKKVAQGCHASLMAFEQAMRTDPNSVQSWKREGQRKIALKIRSEEDLLNIFNQAKSAKLPASLISDAGLTQLKPGTKTAVAIGPATAQRIDKITGNLKLL